MTGIQAPPLLPAALTAPSSPPPPSCSADIDTRSGHIAWWLFLDLVWLYVFWAGVRSVHGEWNPLTLTGSRLFCHIAFHADSTLALARTVFLYTVYTRGRGEGGSRRAAQRSAVRDVDDLLREHAGASASERRVLEERADHSLGQVAKRASSAAKKRA